MRGMEDFSELQEIIWEHEREAEQDFGYRGAKATVEDWSP